MFRLKLHWWVFIGIAVGVLLGVALHSRYYDDVQLEAKVRVIEPKMTGAAEALQGRREEIARARPELSDQQVDEQAMIAVVQEVRDVRESLKSSGVEPAQAERQAISRILGVEFTATREQALTRSIQAAQDALFEETIAGSAVSGIATIFLNLLKMIVLPLVFTSLVAGVTGLGDPKRLGRLGGRTIAWYLTTSLIAILTGLLLVNLIGPGRGQTDINLPRGDGAPLADTPKSVWDVLVRMVPSNLFASAAEGDLFPIIFFALLFGIFTLLVDEAYRRPVVTGITALFQVIMRLTLFIIALAPIGIAALIARLVAMSGPGVFIDLLAYVLTVALGLGIHLLITLPLLFWLLTRRNPYKMLRAMTPALLTGFSTSSSSGTLPLTLERIEHGVGVSNKIGSFVLPLGATINMDGTALYEIVATIFVAQLYATVTPGFDLTLADQFTIVGLALMVSIGAAGIPSAGLVMMVIIFQAVGLPLELTALLWAVDRVLDMCRTSVNIWSDAVGAATVAHFEGEIDERVLFGRDASAAEREELLPIVDR